MFWGTVAGARFSLMGPRVGRGDLGDILAFIAATALLAMCVTAAAVLLGRWRAAPARRRSSRAPGDGSDRASA